MISGQDIELIVVGGSSGSIPVLMQIINSLPDDFKVPVVLIIHRMKNVESELKTLLSSTKKIIEPEDKEPIRQGCVYLAPQNYHLLIEDNKTFSLDYSELVNYSRPSIDVTFMSASEVYKKQTMGILLSGANKDGAEGINTIIKNGGCGIVQDPASAGCPIMPESAIEINNAVNILNPAAIISMILATMK